MQNKNGQSVLEYALIIAVVVAGLLLMQHYVKRGYSGKLKASADDIGEQYDPTAYSGNFEVKNSSLVKQTLKAGKTETEYLDLGGEEAGYGRVQKRESVGDENLSAWGESEDLYKK